LYYSAHFLSKVSPTFKGKESDRGVCRRFVRCRRNPGCPQRSNVFITCVILILLQAHFARQKYMNRPDRNDLPIDIPTSGLISYHSVSEKLASTKSKLKLKLADISQSTEAVIPEAIDAIKKFRDELKEKKVADILPFVDELTEVKKEAFSRVSEAAAKLKDDLITNENNSIWTFFLNKFLSKIERPAPKKRKRMRLILIGDSLVCGVGTDKKDIKDGPG